MITSTSNAQIKELAKLQKKSRLRDEKGIFLVEGPRMTEDTAGNSGDCEETQLYDE